MRAKPPHRRVFMQQRRDDLPGPPIPTGQARGVSKEPGWRVHDRMLARCLRPPDVRRCSILVQNTGDGFRLRVSH